MGKPRKRILQGEHTTEAIVSKINNGMPAYPTDGCPNPWVSSISRWPDSRWYLDNPTPGAPTSWSMMDWDMLFEDGTNLLNSCN